MSIESTGEGTTPRPQGEALEVRLAAATALMEDERAREQSLNTRAIAIAAAALASLAIVGGPLKAAIGLDISGLGHVQLSIAATITVAAALLAIVVAVGGVLMPSARSGMADSMMQKWLQEGALEDREDEARYELLDGVSKTLLSRRAVNSRKASALTWTYRAFLSEIVFALPCVATLAFT